MEVPPGETALWGFDVILREGGRHFVAAGEDCGLIVQRPDESDVVVAAVHAASPRRGKLIVHLLDHEGRLHQSIAKEGEIEPGEPLQEILNVPPTGDFATVEVSYLEKDRTVLQSVERVPLADYSPSSTLPFTGKGHQVFIGVDPDLEHGEHDGTYLQCHALDAGFSVAWNGPGDDPPSILADYSVVAVVGNAWPAARIDELVNWVKSGGGLLVCAPSYLANEVLQQVLPLIPMRAGSYLDEEPLGLKRLHPISRQTA